MRPFTSGRISAESTAGMRPENSDQMRTGLAWTMATPTDTADGAAGAGALPALACQAIRPSPPRRTAAAAPRKARFFRILVVSVGTAPVSKRPALVRSAMCDIVLASNSVSNVTDIEAGIRPSRRLCIARYNIQWQRRESRTAPQFLHGYGARPGDDRILAQGL